MSSDDPTKNEIPKKSLRNSIPPGSSTRYPNPADPVNPDPATLREQWRYAVKHYSRWYSHAWGTAILAGFSFFALGWLIKGSNPLPSLSSHNPKHQDSIHHNHNQNQNHQQ